MATQPLEQIIPALSALRSLHWSLNLKSQTESRASAGPPCRSGFPGFP